MKKYGFLISTILLFNGCGEIDKKEVSKENFKRVLNDYYARNCVTIRGQFPDKFSIVPERVISLEKLGYLKSEKTDSSTIKLFSLTEKGKKVYQNNEGICAFNRKIKSIDNYTEPSNMFGVTMVSVNFTYEPVRSTDIPNDMKQEKVLADLIDKASKKTSDKAKLILTGMKGWIHRREFKK